MRLQPVVASKVILSCITLHNIEKRLGSQFYIPYDDDDEDVNQETNFDDSNVAEHDNNCMDADVEIIEPEAIETLQSLIQLFD